MGQIVPNVWNKMYQKMGKYIVKSVETSRVDKETGEIIEKTKSVAVVKAQSEPFFLTFSKGIMALYGDRIANPPIKVL